MVLQRGPGSAVIWGYATETGDHVTLNVDKEEYSATAIDGWCFLMCSCRPDKAVLKMKCQKDKHRNLHFTLVEHPTISKKNI